MDATEAAACLNCGRALTGQYRAGCGQKQRDTDPTLREFLHETTLELSDWDAKIPSTLKTLFFKPGALTLDFLAGRRARWLPPLRLYLLCSLAFFVIGPIGEALGQRPDRGLAEIVVTNPDGTRNLAPEPLAGLEGSLPARLFGRDRLIRAAVNNEQLNREIAAVLPKGLFMLLPVFALLTMVFWRRRLPRYPAHLYVALHLHAAWFGALALLSMVELFASDVVEEVFGAVSVVYIVVYGLFAVRRIFGESWPRTIAKAAVVSVAYMVCLATVTLAILAYVITRM